MNNFAYTRAASVDEALHQIPAGGAFIAGGTNLVDLMKANVMHPPQLVDITRLPMKQIEDLPGGGLRLGALATNADTAYDPRVTERYPMLSRAILAGASAQLRNAATDAGNLMQRTRCYYFYDTATPCNKRQPGSGCGAIEGVNRIHAILGHSDKCIATHPSDMCVALAALEATVNVTGPAGDRVIAFAEFHRLPGDMPEFDNTLHPGELITSIDMAPKNFGDHYTYLKVRDRASYAFALVSVAVGLEMDGDTIRSARIALGGVAHKPWRLPEVEQMLVGKAAKVESFAPVATALLEGAQDFSHNTFKIELARRSIVRALEEATGPQPRP